MRKNIFDILDSKIDYRDEINSIERILEQNIFIEGIEREFGEPARRTVLNIINKYFLKWDYRGTANNLSDLQKRVDASNLLLLPREPNMQEFLLYCETIYNACNNALYYNEYYNAKLPLNAIMENIEKALSKIGYKIYNYDNELKSIVIINNENAVAAACLTDETNATKIIEYNSYLLIGDIEGKKSILKILADKFETIRKDLKANNFITLEEDIGFLLNNLDIRHANQKGKPSGKYISGITKKKLEIWYDKTYNLILTAIMSLERIKIGQDIKKLKQEILEKEKNNG